LKQSLHGMQATPRVQPARENGGGSAAYFYESNFMTLSMLVRSELGGASNFALAASSMSSSCENLNKNLSDVTQGAWCGAVRGRGLKCVRTTALSS
jgi:hypothetical protein